MFLFARVCRVCGVRSFLVGHAHARTHALVLGLALQFVVAEYWPGESVWHHFSGTVGCLMSSAESKLQGQADATGHDYSPMPASNAVRILPMMNL